MSIGNLVGDIEITSGDFVVEGTGWLVGPRHLVTAQHVVLDEFGNLESRDGFNVSFDNGTFAKAQKYYWSPHPEFSDGDTRIADANTQFDFAYILLDRDIGLQNGYFSYGLPEAFSAQKLKFAGYPGGRFDADTLYTDSVEPSYNFFFNFINFGSQFARPGASGGPVYVEENGQRFVVGLLSSADATTGTAGAITPSTLRDLDAFRAGAFESNSPLATQGSDQLIGSKYADDIFGKDGDDTISGRGGQDLLSGGSGGDRLFGDAGRDQLYGDSGKDRLKGGDGDDRLWGGVGDDLLFGGKGQDTLSGGDDQDRLEGGAGRDLLRGDGQRDRLIGGSGDDILKGGNGNDNLRGNDHNDRLNGNRGDDALFGGRGADVLNGARGNDRLFGNRGEDTLEGGGGRDVLTGGRGLDTFVFNASSGKDRITDFGAGETIEIASGANQFSDLSLKNTSEGTQVSFRTVKILVEDVRVSDLGADDFTFS